VYSKAVYGRSGEYAYILISEPGVKGVFVCRVRTAGTCV